MCFPTGAAQDVNITITANVWPLATSQRMVVTPRRWQKNKDILWYTREKGSDEAQQRADELAAIKAREEDLMAEVQSARSWTSRAA